MGKTPQIIHLTIGFSINYFHHPFWGFAQPPIFGNKKPSHFLAKETPMDNPLQTLQPESRYVQQPGPIRLPHFRGFPVSRGHGTNKIEPAPSKGCQLNPKEWLIDTL